MSDPVIEIENLSFSYNKKNVLADINISVSRGKFVAMIGPNGGGKTTLLKLIMGLLRPDTGTVTVMGERPENVSHRMGYVPQKVDLNFSFPITVLDLVLMGRLGKERRWKKFSHTSYKKAHEVLEKIGMLDYRNVKTAELSGGQYQRVLIARALISDPEIMLFDEPTASIDTKGQVDFYDLLAALDDHITIIVVSHDLLVISEYVDSVACVNKRLHYHQHGVVTEDMLETMYSCSVERVCPVSLVARKKLAPDTAESTTTREAGGLECMHSHLYRARPQAGKTKTRKSFNR